jgi:5-(carboxyamino)imidazole ribonucleotide synthase
MMNPGSEVWIGVLGGGQLGRMLALEARRMGFRVLMWTGGDTSGAATLADLVLTDPFDSAAAFDKFVGCAHVATVEFENIPASLLESLSERLPLMPGTKAVSTSQHREREKLFLAANGIPCAGFQVVDSSAKLREALAALPGDAILKTAEFGYDGKGQIPISAGLPDVELEQLWADFASPRAVLEEKIDLAAELSVIVVRGQDGELVTFDPAENQHRHHILDVSIVPARLPQDLLEQARQVAMDIAVALDYVGVLGVEFFVCTDGRLLVNEMAPRPHNSGHHTLDACETSQFEQQLRAISGMPLGSTRLIEPAVMWNVLGDLWADPTTPPDWTPVLKTPGAKLHLYGKDRASKGRKMGHITFTAATLDEASAHANACRQAFGYDEIA